MDRDELGTLFLRYRPDVIRIAAKTYTLLDQDTLDQLYTDTWVSVSRANNLHRSTLKSYLVECLKNRIKNHLRDCLRSQDIMSHCPVLSLSNPETVIEADRCSYTNRANDPTLNLDDEEANERYEAVMSGLPSMVRLAVELYFIDGCTQEEVACHFQVTRSKVVRLLEKGVKMLRKRYAYWYEARKRGDL